MKKLEVIVGSSPMIIVLDKLGNQFYVNVDPFVERFNLNKSEEKIKILLALGSRFSLRYTTPKSLVDSGFTSKHYLVPVHLFKDFLENIRGMVEDKKYLDFLAANLPIALLNMHQTTVNITHVWDLEYRIDQLEKRLKKLENTYANDASKQ